MTAIQRNCKLSWQIIFGKLNEPRLLDNLCLYMSNIKQKLDNVVSHLEQEIRDSQTFQVVFHQFYEMCSSLVYRNGTLPFRFYF